VDVPSLDAVLFLNPRNSQVDVVQSVGRVMRKAEGKEYGYIILPIAVPASQDPETALNDNKKYKVVWDVLQALRAHDDRFEAMINKLDLNRNANDVIDVIAVTDPFNEEDGGAPAGEKSGTETAGTQETLFALARADEWRNAIFARMVRKVGDRRYWESWATDVKEIADRHVIRIRTILDGPDPRAREEFAVFLEGLRGNLNDGISESDAIDMLSQHLITKPVFEALFDGYSFAAHNPVSQVMDSMIAVLEQYNLDSEVQNLEDFYRSVRIRAEGVSNAEGKQKIITELYERFFKLAFPRTAESLGIVYTPVEVVDFIIRAVDDVLAKDFNSSLSAPGVHVLDPFAGTGTFTVRLLQSGRIKPEDLLRKYTQELHANEILLMAYYIAAINIEATLHGLLEDQAASAVESNPMVEPSPVVEPVETAYIPFDGMVLTDTFQMSEDGDTLDEHVFTSNNDRLMAQNKLDIRVIIGNPPYSVGQSSGNDNNANLKYPTLDESIRYTYADRSTATLKNSLYDSYIRAIRWASTRILTSPDGGVVAYVSNGGYIDGNTADGLRKTLVDEFHDIYVYNLRGNQRTAGEQSRREGGKIFDSGSRNTVAILILVKKSGLTPGAVLHYKDIGDYLDRKEKLAIVDAASIGTLDWATIRPNAEGDWINQRNDVFESFTPIAEKARGGAKPTIFADFSGGLKTNRDAWVYNFSMVGLESATKRMITNYGEQLRRGVIDREPTMVSWSSGLESLHSRGTEIAFNSKNLRTAVYRPFTKMKVYFDDQLNDRRGRLPQIFPSATSENVGFYLPAPGNSAPPFLCLAVDTVPDLGGAGISGVQFFPRYTYTTPAAGDDLFSAAGGMSSPEKVDNVTDATLAEYRAAYGASVSKDDIFFYVYGLLHSPEYRKEFAADLKKMLPRIPKVPGTEKFMAFSQAGRELSALHIGYEQQEPYRLTVVENAVVPAADEYAKYAVKKMKYGGKAGAWDKTRIIYNSHVTLEGVPAEAQRYMLGARSAVDWILERYQVKTDKASGIVNDPNDWSREHGQPRYIIDLIGRIVTVSLETNRIVDGLPSLDLA
jgi:predicted helicase